MPKATPSFERRLALYSTAAGVALAASAAPAAAQERVPYSERPATTLAPVTAPSAFAPTYTDIEPDQVLAPNEGLPLDIDNDGNDDFQLALFGNNTMGGTSGRLVMRITSAIGDAGNGMVGQDAPYFTNPAYGSAFKLDSGTEIGSSDQFFNNGVLASLYGGSPYYPFTGESGLAGFRFVATGNTHYGWIRLAATSSVDGATAFEYAFESVPDTPINAGATGSTPNEGVDALTHHIELVGSSPISERGRLDLAVAQSQHVTVQVYDLNGRLVSTLMDGTQQGGVTRVILFDTGAWASGTYLVRVQGEQFAETRRITVL